MSQPERDALLGTKLHVPGPPPGFVARPRLAARLDEGLSRRLTLVCAPAGSGKTALLADWVGAGHDGQRRPAAWLSLDPGDNDPARFWRHVAAALDQAGIKGANGPVISDRIGPLLGPPPPPSFEPAVTALINELDRGRALLVLDDYHLVNAEPLHEALVFLLDHMPPGLHLVLATRSEPPLGLSRLRARGQLAELRAAELRFTAQEAAELLGPGLTSEAVETLTARTEGWAAGLRLAALSLRGQHDAAAFVAAFGGSHRYVLDYLAEEVLDRQDAQVRAFLLETSVLDRLSGDLCDAVTGRPGGQQMLERIERAGLFLLPLDEVRGWWRYHHLFADLLRVRLRQERPGQVGELHRAAATWHAAHGLADDAVHHAVAAGEPERAAELIERYFDAVYFTGESATLRRWLATLPEDLVRGRARLSLARAFMALVADDPAAAQMAIASVGNDPDDSFRPSVGPEASLITNVPAATAIARAWLAYLRGDPGQMIEFASSARTRLRDGDWLLGSIYWLNLALAHWLSGRLDEAESGFTAAIDGWRAAGQRALAAQGCNFLGQVRRARGDLDGALDAYRKLLQIAGLQTGQQAGHQAQSPVAGIGHVGIAEVHYERDDLAAARRHLAEGLPLCRQLSEPQALATGLALSAWIRLAEGDAAGAAEALAEAERAGPSPSVADLLNPVPAHRARLQLARGDVAAAARWAARKGLAPDDEPGYAGERDHLVLARVLLAQDRPGPALGLLDRLLAAAESQGRTGSVIEIRALRALALARRGDQAQAAKALAEALILASPQGQVRVFADEGPPMAALLGQVQARGAATHLARVRRACLPPGGRGARAAGLIEPLTSRETQVLELLATGSPNQRIAEDLVVTLDTVKKHVTHVLGKLGAANRTEAVAKARRLRLID